jgi:flagellar motor switch protein FliN/FliY
VSKMFEHHEDEALRSTSEAPMAQPTPSVSMSIDQIEILLKMARSNLQVIPPDEDLGPGELQYLRGGSSSQSVPTFTYPSAIESTRSERSHSRDIQGEQSPFSIQTNEHARPSETDRGMAESRIGEGKPHPLGNPGGHSIPEAPVADVHSWTAPDLVSRIPSTHNSSGLGLTLEDLGDVDLEITIELGRSELLIEDVLNLDEGSVVSLDRKAGDPVDILANGRLIARGELLVVDGKFGVRLSEIL